MLHASTRKLIDRLAEMTELNKLDWTESEAGQIIYSTEGYSVALTEDPNELVITSKDGKELERATPEELAATQSDEGVAYTAIVSAMTAEAARIARGTEAAISSLLAGMEEPADTSDVAATEEVSGEEDLAEDQGDDTNVVDAETIETVAPTEETDAVTSETEDSDHAEAALETTENQSDAEQDELEAGDEAVTAAISTAEEAPEPDAETESDVTEAVARLADEVNQREDSSLDAAAASAVGAVALAAGLAATDDTVEEKTETPETASDFGAGALSDAEPTKYVPFGLEESAPESGSEAAPILTDTPETVDEVSPTVVEDAPAPVAAMDISTSETAEPVQPEVSESEPLTSDSTETEPMATEDTTGDTVVPFAAFTSASGEDTPATSEPTKSEERLETVAEVSVEDTAAAFEPQDQVSSVGEAASADATPESEPIQDPVAAFSVNTPSEVEQVTESTPAVAAPEPTTPAVEPAQTIAIDTQPTAAPQSYSLSGIGAGFGLGALSAKTEASGVPGPSAAAEAEKVVIDATEDVLPEIDGKPALPEGLPGVANTTASSEMAPAEPASEAEESDILKPRTRFNPWD